MCTLYQLLERIDSVTPLYRGLYTTVSKKAINTVWFAVSSISIVFVWWFDELIVTYCNVNPTQLSY